MKKIRLDEFLMQKGDAVDRLAAFVLVTEGRVRVNGQKAVSPAMLIMKDARVEVWRIADQYVGRGALKLAGALDEFQLDPTGMICADIGAATGGFTEVLLRRGAVHVYAIDTAYGKLALKLREDPRVVVKEKTDVRKMPLLPEAVDLAVSDVSLISLRNILPSIVPLLKPDGCVVVLFKPQYETRDPKLLKNGVVVSQVAREEMFADFLRWVEKNGWRVQGKMRSPIRGTTGNVEYLVLLMREFASE